MRPLLIAAAALVVSTSALAVEPAPIEVMVLSTYHFDNPGKDVNNVKADDVLTPRRQQELEALTAELARFRPTKVAIEGVSRNPNLTDTGYEKFTPDELAKDRNEIVQIGYRLAHKLGHKAVYAIDEQAGPGQPSYFPYDKVLAYSEAKGRGEELAAMSAPLQARLKVFEAAQKTTPIAGLLLDLNNPKTQSDEHRDFYNQSLRFGDASEQPGAELIGGWYLRNAKIFTKLLSVAKPGDRIIVVYGGGHGYWLRHFSSESTGIRSVDPIPYLRAAAAKRK